MRIWIRAGLILLIVLDGIVGAWQYFFPRSFFTDFPTVSLDPPYNEHLVSDVGGLNLALVTVLAFAAVWLEYRLVMAALTGFAVYSATHFLFHVRHFQHFSLGDAVGVPSGPPEHVLHAIGGGIPGVLGDRPAVLARQIGQQPQHEGADPPPALDSAEPVGDPIQQLISENE